MKRSIGFVVSEMLANLRTLNRLRSYIIAVARWCCLEEE